MDDDGDHGAEDHDHPKDQVWQDDDLAEKEVEERHPGDPLPPSC